MSGTRECGPGNEITGGSGSNTGGGNIGGFGGNTGGGNIGGFGSGGRPPFNQGGGGGSGTGTPVGPVNSESLF